MNNKQVECLVLLKSPHDNPIYLMVQAVFSQEEVTKERTKPGSSIMDYTFNEKVILRDRYFKGAVLGCSFEGTTDNNDAFQFVRFITLAEADTIIRAAIGEGRYNEPVETDYELYMYDLFPECSSTPVQPAYLGTDYEAVVKFCIPKLKIFMEDNRDSLMDDVMAAKLQVYLDQEIREIPDERKRTLRIPIEQCWPIVKLEKVGFSCVIALYTGPYRFVVFS